MSRCAMLVLVLLGGCAEKGVVCDTMAVSSVLVHLTDAEGAPLGGEIAATDEAGARVDTQCATSDTGGVACADWIVGWEVAGTITITASASDGCNTGTGTVSVEVPMDASGCHVVSQEVTLPITEWTDLDCG